MNKMRLYDNPGDNVKIAINSFVDDASNETILIPGEKCTLKKILARDTENALLIIYFIHSRAYLHFKFPHAESVHFHFKNLFTICENTRA